MSAGARTAARTPRDEWPIGTWSGSSWKWPKPAVSRLAPRFVELQRVYSGLLVDLKCEMRSADIVRLEADVSVQLEEPENPDLKRVKIGRLHIMPFVSPSYVEVYGMPKDLEDLQQNHRMVIQEGEQTRGREMYDKHAGREQLGLVAMRNNVYTAH